MTHIMLDIIWRETFNQITEGLDAYISVFHWFINFQTETKTKRFCLMLYDNENYGFED